MMMRWLWRFGGRPGETRGGERGGCLCVCVCVCVCLAFTCFFSFEFPSRTLAYTTRMSAIYFRKQHVSNVLMIFMIASLATTGCTPVARAAKDTRAWQPRQPNAGEQKEADAYGRPRPVGTKETTIRYDTIRYDRMIERTKSNQ